MTTWQSAMLCLVPLILFTGVGGIRGMAAILRTWAVVMAASLLTYALDPQALAMPYNVYFMIDLLAGVVIAVPRSGLEQRAIAALFCMMALIDAAAAWQHAGGLGIFNTAMSILGWTMWFILLAWGVRDAGRGLVAYFTGGGAAVPVVPDHKAVGQRASGIIEP